MRIPLPNMMRHWREREFEKRITPTPVRYGIGLWAIFATRPALYRFATGIAMKIMAAIGGRRGRFGSMPLAGGWTDHRDLPAPEGPTFSAQWKARKA